MFDASIVAISYLNTLLCMFVETANKHYNFRCYRLLISEIEIIEVLCSVEFDRRWSHTPFNRNFFHWHTSPFPLANRIHLSSDIL